VAILDSRNLNSEYDTYSQKRGQPQVDALSMEQVNGHFLHLGCRFFIELDANTFPSASPLPPPFETTTFLDFVAVDLRRFLDSDAEI
jgi:hypothetical protein